MRQQARYGRFRTAVSACGRHKQQKKQNERGLNENYGRELMELHTLGVDGGYTQKDVTEVARCFTGWTIEKPRQNPEFKFDERLHDPDPKIRAGKEDPRRRDEGRRASDRPTGPGPEHGEIHLRRNWRGILFRTIRRRRWWSAWRRRFRTSDGDIRAVMRTMIYSPEFWSREAYRAKIKTPFELVVSAARALGTDVDMPLPLVQWIGRIGEPLYQCQPPTGYSDKADTWVNTGALLNRLNFSLALASNRMRGSRTDVGAFLGWMRQADAKAALDRAVEFFLGGQVAPRTVETLEKQLDNPQILQASWTIRRSTWISAWWQGWFWARRNFRGDSASRLNLKQSQSDSWAPIQGRHELRMLRRRSQC